MGASFFFDADDKVSESYDCSCSQGIYPPNPNCYQCKGTGIYKDEHGAHEFHFSYSSSYDLFDAIGFEYDSETYAGTLEWKNLETYMDNLLDAIVAGLYDPNRGSFVMKALRTAWSRKADIHFG